MDFLLEGILAITPQQLVMYVVGVLLIWLAIKKGYEPSLLLPMGFGAILVNLPLSGVINQVMEGVGGRQELFSGYLRRQSRLPRPFRFCYSSVSEQ